MFAPPQLFSRRHPTPPRATQPPRLTTPNDNLTPLSGPDGPDSRARTVPPNLSELCHSSTCMMTFRSPSSGRSQTNPVRRPHEIPRSPSRPPPAGPGTPRHARFDQALSDPGRPPAGPSLGTTSGKKSETINQERSGKISSAQVSIETGQLHSYASFVLHVAQDDVRQRGCDLQGARHSREQLHGHVGFVRVNRLEPGS